MIIPFLLVGQSAFADEQALQSLSVWQNQNGSTLTIDSVDPATGQMTGSYINNASGYSCQGTPYPITGYVYDNHIGWVVRWSNASEDCQAITSWTGYYASEVITTDWNLVYGTQILS